MVDRRTRQTKSANNIEGHSEELWEPDPNKLTNESGKDHVEDWRRNFRSYHELVNQHFKLFPFFHFICNFIIIRLISFSKISRTTSRADTAWSGLSASALALTKIIHYRFFYFADFCVRSSAPAPRRPTPNTKQISPKQGVTNHDYYVTNGHKIRSTDEPDCSTPRNLSSTSKSGGKLVSPAYSCRNGEVSDARVRHIKSSQRQLPPDPQPAGLGQLKSTDEPDFSRVRQQIGTNQLKPDDEADFSRLLHFSSSKRVTPSPLKRLSGLVRMHMF